MYEFFEHTADVGLRVRARTLNELFADAGRGLFNIIVDNIDDVKPAQERNIRFQADDHESLLYNWLSELLYIFESEHLVLANFEVTVMNTSLHARASGEKLDPSRHHVASEVKAVTYHALKLEKTPDGWLAELILDV